MAGLVGFVLLMAALIGLFFGWGHWRDQFRGAQPPTWRRAAINVALFGVTLQALLFIVLWTPISRHHVLIVKLMKADFVLALATVPCVFAWRGRARWLLLGSAVFFPAVSFLSVLAELAY